MRSHRQIGLLLACCLVAGCGDGGAAGSARRTPATIAPAVGAALARQADVIAATAELGDSCTLLIRARDFQRDVDAAIADGQIPRRLRAALRSSAESLSDGVSCRPDPQPKHGDGHHRRHGRGHGRGQGDD